MKHRLILLLIPLFLALYNGCSGDRNSGNRGSSEDPNDEEGAPGVVVVPPLIFSPTPPVINVYVENSGSMLGYIDRGDTDFKTIIDNYLVHVNRYRRLDRCSYITSI